MPVSDEQRRHHLVNAIRSVLQWPGYRVESQGIFDAVIVGRPANHVLHAILSLVTMGLWLIVWLWIALTYQPERISVAVDEEGRCTVYSMTKRKHLTWTREGALVYR